MWATGVYDLGLTDAQFWALTPRQLNLLIERFLDSEERMSQRFGLLAALYANAHRDREKHPRLFELQDFAPSRHVRSVQPHPHGHCQECGVREGFGHTADCKHGQSIVQYNLAALAAIFSKSEQRPGAVWRERREG